MDALNYQDLEAALAEEAAAKEQAKQTLRDQMAMALERRPKNVDLSATAALFDSIYGTKLLPAFKPVEDNTDEVVAGLGSDLAKLEASGNKSSIIAEQKKLDREAATQRQALQAADKKEAALAKAISAPAKQPSATEFGAAGFARRLEQSENVFDQLEQQGFDRAATESRLEAFLPGELKDPRRVQQDQAERNFVNSVLRRESGAAISPTEFASAEQQYFYRPGDSPQVKAQKKANRLQVQAQLKAEGARALPSVPLVEIQQVQAAPALSRRQLLEQLRAQKAGK